ncbi:MAG: NADH-quinone oxidoreductase subunit D, partial [Pseudomonadota bacterium]
MPVVKLQRPDLSLAEKLTLPAIFKGFLVTLGHAVKSLAGKSRGGDSLKSSGLGVTMQYPEQKWDEELPEYYRGVP